MMSASFMIYKRPMGSVQMAHSTQSNRLQSEQPSGSNSHQTTPAEANPVEIETIHC